MRIPILATITSTDCRRAAMILDLDDADPRSSTDAEWLHRHIESCPRCRETAIDAAQAHRMVRAYRQDLITIPPADWHDIRSQLAPSRSPVRIWQGPRQVPGWAAALGAMLLVMCASWLWHVRSGNRSKGKPTPPVIAKNQAPSQARTQAHESDAPPRHEDPKRGLDHAYRTQELATTATKPGGRMGMPRSSAIRQNDDLAFLNEDGNRVLAGWTVWSKDKVAEIQRQVDDAMRRAGKGDDFVQVPFPQVAGADSASLQTAASAYKHEKDVVDPRLSRNVTVAAKAAALGDLCQQLATRTGIELTANRSVADEKVTLFCDETPLREVMRQINHLFGFNWARSGEEGSYRYTLTESLSARLAEEEMRNHSLHEALLALDKKLQDRLAGLANSNDWDWKAGALRAYGLLGAADRAALVNGDEVELSGNGDDAGRSIPPDVNKQLLHNFNLYWWSGNGYNSVQAGKFREGDRPLWEQANASANVGLRLDNSEAGTLSLKVDIGGAVGPRDNPLAVGRFSYDEPLVSATAPAILHPDNVTLQHAHMAEPAFRRIVNIVPISSCPHYAPGAASEIPEENDLEAKQQAADGPHVFSWDIWEAVHRETHTPVIADAYSRYYRIADVSFRDVTLFDALCKASDKMGVLWKKDEGFLQCRSAGFVWDKLKEVPNRLLDRWAADARREGGLPLADLAEMATLSDTQLESTVVGKVIEHCRGLSEWSLLANGQPRLGLAVPGEIRPYLRLIATFSAAQRDQALRPEGIQLSSLHPNQLALLRSVGARHGNTFSEPEMRMHLNYVPAGRYTWHPVVKGVSQEIYLRWPVVSCKSRDEAIEAAKAIYPKVSPNQITVSKGDLDFEFMTPDGHIYAINRQIAIPAE